MDSSTSPRKVRTIPPPGEPRPSLPAPTSSSRRYMLQRQSSESPPAPRVSRNSRFLERDRFRLNSRGRSWQAAPESGCAVDPLRARLPLQPRAFPGTRRSPFPFCAWRGIVTEIHFPFLDLNVRTVNDAARLSLERVAPLHGSS